MLDLVSVPFNEMENRNLDEILKLRKSVFRDRLGWDVVCNENKEFDQYDNHRAVYLFGIVDGNIICSARLIDMQYPTMTSEYFAKYFPNTKPPADNFVEATRFFVDKERASILLQNNKNSGLFLSLGVVNYALSKGYAGIVSIANDVMYILLKKSGLKVSVLEHGFMEKGESIRMLHLHVDQDSQQGLINNIIKTYNINEHQLRCWPMSLLPTS